MNKNVLRGLVAVGVLTAVGAANAAVDTASATTGITDAAQALGVVFGALITMAAGLFGLKKIYGAISGK